MKKFIVFLIISICLSNTSVSATSIFKEGVYKPSDFNYSQDSTYNVQNVSSTESVYFAVFDDNQVVLQALKLEPNSLTHKIPPLKPSYRFAVIGDGEVNISEIISTN